MKLSNYERYEVENFGISRTIYVKKRNNLLFYLGCIILGFIGIFLISLPSAFAVYYNSSGAGICKDMAFGGIPCTCDVNGIMNCPSNAQGVLTNKTINLSTNTNSWTWEGYCVTMKSGIDGQNWLIYAVNSSTNPGTTGYIHPRGTGVSTTQDLHVKDRIGNVVGSITDVFTAGAHGIKISFLLNVSINVTIDSVYKGNLPLTNYENGTHFAIPPEVDSNMSMCDMAVYNGTETSQPDITFPIINISLNDTSLSQNDVVNVTGNSSDDIGLSFCQIIINQTGRNEYFNFSLSGTSGFCSQNFTITNPNGVLNFTTRVNDTSNNFNQTSTILSIADTTPPTLNNCTLQFSTLTDASGNTNTFNCTATDIGGSNIQSMSFDLNGSLNKTISFSVSQSQSVSGSYDIFQSLETLRVGSYSIRNVSVTDTSDNKLVNSTLFDFSVTSAPSGGGSPPSGGGGGGTTTKTIIIKEGIPLLSFGGLTLIDFNVIVTPSKKVKLVRFRNVGNVTFANAKVSIEGDANKYINPFVCNLNFQNCMNESINIRAGESMFLSLNGTFTEELGEGTSGVVKIQEAKERGVAHELNLLVARPPLFKIIKPLSNFKLIGGIADVMGVSPELISFVVVYVSTGVLIIGSIWFTTLL